MFSRIAVFNWIRSPDDDIRLANLVLCISTLDRRLI